MLTVVAQDVVALGGRGRAAHVSVVDAPALPDVPQSFPDGRVSVYLATSALLDSAWWHPPQARLCALAMSGPHPVATASPRQGFADSRQLTWAASAGTVFYLKFATDSDARQWADGHRDGLLPGQRALPIVTAGFGTCFLGRW